MSGWSAINIEQEDDSDIEIDDTKEIQLEEAFKLYQVALKLHSQGPSYHGAAREAYNELFKSEVFHYPEAASEFDQDQLEDSSPTFGPVAGVAIVPVAAGAPTDNANSLPQLLYLARKSRAQFEIDSAHVLHDRVVTNDRLGLFRHYGQACREALCDSAAALECDDTDIDLWKRAGRVSEVLQTVRIVRFCLESVLAGDEEGEDAIDLSGLDEAFAKGELQHILNIIQDSLTETRSSNARPRNALLDVLKRSNDPYPFLPPKPQRLDYVDDKKRPFFCATPASHQIQASSSYSCFTNDLYEALASQENGSSDPSPGAYVQIQIPDQRDATDVEMIPEVEDAETATEAKFAQDLSTTTTGANAETPESFHSVPEARLASKSPENLSMKDTTDEAKVEQPATTGLLDLPGIGADQVNLPSRKRSSTVAGNEEPEARSKSKRIKARESLAGTYAQEEEVCQDPSSINRDQFIDIETKDVEMFRCVNAIIEKIGIASLSDIEDFREPRDNEADVDPNTLPSTDQLHWPVNDLKEAIRTWNEEKSGAFNSGHGGRDHVEKGTGLSLFLKHSKAGLAKEASSALVDNVAHINAFAGMVNELGITIAETLFLWLVELFTSSGLNGRCPLYLQGLWSLDLKESIVKVLGKAHGHILTCFQQYTCLSAATSSLQVVQQSRDCLSAQQATEFAQAMFELHLDLYAQSTKPESIIDSNALKQYRSRLQMWAHIATDMIQIGCEMADHSMQEADPLALRFLWASVTFVQLSDSIDKRHLLMCLNDLQDVLAVSQGKEIYLPNHSIMPVISPAAVQQEITKVKTLEFFMSVFESDNSDPTSVIMKLEPILEYDAVLVPKEVSADEREQIENFQSFLGAGDASLTLFLWKKLQNAYTAISYNTKVVSCLLRSTETIVQEISSMQTADQDTSERGLTLLRWLRDADELLTKTLSKIADDKTAFEAIDEAHLKSSISAVLSLIRIIHGFVLVDDNLRAGYASPPVHRNATALKNFEKCRDRFREMHVRLWTLLYLLIKEATVQMSGSFERPEHDLVIYLRYVHDALGSRKYCKYCNKLFVRIAKADMFSLEDSEDVSMDIAQLMYDLYQIRLLAGYGDMDHGCSAETLERDKRTAQSLVPIIMDYVRRLNVKDLLRSELKTTIDRIQSALGQAKPLPAVSFNRRAVTTYLKSFVNPRHLYLALKGIGELETKLVHGESAKIANQGWYLLLGNMTLAKYRSVKRVNPTPTDELDNALSSLRQDIEYNASNWESWYRLAEVYDAKIEDSLIWNSNKLNDGRAELATLERNAINAYTMATVIAMRSASNDSITAKLINDMLFEFATRLYASSRPPLNMEAFNNDKAVRYLSDYSTQAMSQKPLFRSMSERDVWSYAAYLIRKSLSGDLKPWLRYYMLGKCYWKMFNSEENSQAKDRVDVEDVIDALSEAVNRVPKKERSTDPILEPHSKLVSFVHKLQAMKVISVNTAVDYLQVSSYARASQITNDQEGNPDWETYILRVLKKLQTADKSGWHHRITARAAHVLYDTDPSISNALGAKHQFADSIFTKNMTMQVWKPENERAGRHYVYTGRYLRFFVEILDKLRDRSNLEQVVRKIRRKTTDFINHTKVWEDAVTAYMDLLRRTGDIPRGRERALFDNVSFDDFTRQSEKLEQWTHEPTTTTHYLEIIKDAIEMKKLNNSLMKSSVIDDLIGDAYACMYELYVSQLPPEEQAIAPKNTLPQGSFINLTTETAPTGDDNLDRMRLNNLLSGPADGASGLAETTTVRTAGLGILTQGLPTSETPPPDAVRVPAPAKPGRAKTITKREVQKKAEAAIGKPPPIKTPILTKRSILINVPSIKKDKSEDQNDDGADLLADQTHMTSELSSRRGSISMRNSPNPDADDEGGDGDNEEDEDDDEEEVEDDERDESEADGQADNNVENEDDEDSLEVPDSQDLPGIEPHEDIELDTD